MHRHEVESRGVFDSCSGWARFAFALVRVFTTSSGPGEFPSLAVPNAAHAGTLRFHRRHTGTRSSATRQAKYSGEFILA